MKTHQGEAVAWKILGGALLFAGVAHLTFERKAFQAQVPDWVPLDKDDTVLLSGVAEIALGGAILSASPAARKPLGIFAAAFFTAVFPGNISQYTHRRSAFGLDTDNKRFARLFFQPVLIYWALKSSGALDGGQRPVVSRGAAVASRSRPSPTA